MTVITRPQEDIWEADTNYMVVPVNTVAGVMGAGMALTLKRWEPKAVTSHVRWCEGGAMGGDVLMTHYRSPGGAQIALLATKEDWRKGSRLDWVQRGLERVLRAMQPASTVALPLLGSGRGGLHPERVERVVQEIFAAISDKIAFVYPDHVPAEMKGNGRGRESREW